MPPELHKQNSPQTLRFGAGRAAASYGLPVEDSLIWHTSDQAGQFRVDIELADLQAGEILLPSLVLLSQSDYAFACSLTADGHQWWLATVDSNPDEDSIWKGNVKPSGLADLQEADSQETGVSTHIDYFAAHELTRSPTLSVHVKSETAPSDYLLVVSRRKQDLTPNLPSQERVQHQVPRISQMMQPAAQRHRTCSPTAVSMLLAHHQSPYQPALIDACKDRKTNLYGIWPLNIVQAGRRGFTGAAELISSWQELAHFAEPFIASISFEKDELHGAPLEQTKGHLVVVCGTTADRVLCNDPAAPDADSVARAYDLKQFTQAWLGSRGATYLIRPAIGPQMERRA